MTDFLSAPSSLGAEPPNVLKAVPEVVPLHFRRAIRLWNFIHKTPLLWNPGVQCAVTDFQS